MDAVIPLAKVGMLCSMSLLLLSSDRVFGRIRTMFTLSAEDNCKIEQREVIYVLISLRSHQFYVGRTKCVTDRIRQHYQAAIRGEKDRKYSHIRAVGAHHYFLVPVHAVDSHTNDASLVEKAFISRLNPSLNTMLAKKSKKSRKRAPMKLRKSDLNE